MFIKVKSHTSQIQNNKHKQNLGAACIEFGIGGTSSIEDWMSLNDYTRIRKGDAKMPDSNSNLPFNLKYLLYIKSYRNIYFTEMISVLWIIIIIIII